MQARIATIEDASQISALIRGLSDPFFVAPGGEGAELFMQSISKAAIQGYVTASNFVYQVAESEGRLVGVVAVRDNSHLYHLFITAEFQGRGMARNLWQLAKAQAVRAGNPGRFTVNSSLGAVPVYKRFGFVPSQPAVTKHGISFQPMVLNERGG
ncbi:GNAT family N-acetyltransferase [Noviherbaspirillum galbum]|uniref:GNAT family N-acetyltransferase n=1 Tax=Noviherbaspirillum galbum TaxID=2709383 RepID=A0A6B3SYM2_9BURK|nr:GNAT family N-acetyltransferase [Noviherbaspirillum galbum]NEX64566.1 GNAT family N-acetyltransferase [Noviherbaspirillum galbum]